MHLLVAYATTDGMTAQIAERIGQIARIADVAVDVFDTARLPEDFDPESYDAILLGASMHAQGYQRAARRFIERYRGTLRTRPSGFFSVSLSIVSRRSEERDAAQLIAEAFPLRLGWNPGVIVSFAGALMFSRYGFLRRAAMKRIAAKELGVVDPTHDTVFTDWATVDQFAAEFIDAAALVTDRTSAPPPSPPPVGGAPFVT